VRDDNILTPATAGTAADLMADYRAARGILMNDPGWTVGGVLLDFNLVQTSTRSSSDDGVTLGLIVASEETAAEVPLPNDPQGAYADWIWRTFIGSPGAASGSSISTFQALGGPVRAKAMRRMDEVGMNLYLVAQSIGLTTYSLPYQSSALMIMP